MVEEGNPSDDPVAPPKKKGIVLSIFLAPTSEVDTSIGKVYLYPLRLSDIGKIEKLSAGEPISKLRDFLPCIASLSIVSKIEKERDPLTPVEVAKLSDPEIEQIAEAYALSSNLQQTRLGKDGKEGLPRQDGEMAVSYLDRIFSKYLSDQAESMQSWHKKMFGPASSLFDSVRKSSSNLTNSLTEYEKLSSVSVTPAMDTGILEFSNRMAEQHAKQARERAEELDMVRMTGKMTAQSATTLRDLAEAATVLLERLDARDEKSDRVTRKQLWIAVGSVVISALLALVALIYSGASYYQDKANNVANDKWQSDLLSSIQEDKSQRQTLEAENFKLKLHLEKLERSIASKTVPKVAQGTGSNDSNSTSTARQSSNAGNTLP